MTDEAFVFNQDVRERSKMKTGAVHKKNGSKSRKCVLPSDSLTPAQKKKLNGKVVAIKMNEPIHSWSEFKELPDTIKTEYLNNLVNNYGARECDVAAMMNTKTDTLWQYLYHHNNVEVKFPRGRRGIDERFVSFLNKCKTIEEPIAAKSDEEILNERFDIPCSATANEKEIEPEPIKETHIFQPMVSMNMVLNGQREQILKMLETILGDGNEYKMAIDISAVERCGE